MSFHDLDFATRRPTPLWQTMALTILVIAGIWGGWRYAREATSLGDLQEQVKAHQFAQRQTQTATVELVPQLPKEAVKAVNEAVESLNVPWPKLLEALESSRPPKVALVRVEPRTKERQMVITAQADNMVTLLGYMQGLADKRPFSKVLPVRQEIIQEVGQTHSQAVFEVYWTDQP